MIFCNNIDLLIHDPIRREDASEVSTLFDVRIEIANGKLLNRVLDIAIAWCYFDGYLDSCCLLGPCPH